MGKNIFNNYETDIGCLEYTKEKKKINIPQSTKKSSKHKKQKQLKIKAWNYTEFSKEYRWLRNSF